MKYKKFIEKYCSPALLLDNNVTTKTLESFIRPNKIFKRIDILNWVDGFHSLLMSST